MSGKSGMSNTRAAMRHGAPAAAAAARGRAAGEDGTPSRSACGIERCALACHGVCGLSEAAGEGGSEKHEHRRRWTGHPASGPPCFIQHHAWLAENIANRERRQARAALPVQLRVLRVSEGA